MKPISRLSIFACLLCSAGSAHADLFLGLEAGASTWNAAPKGQLGETPASLSQLGFDEENYNSFYIGVELLGLPEFRLSRTRLDNRGQGVTGGAFNLGGNSYPANTSLTTDIDIEITDLTVYWQILDNYLSADLGVTARMLEGSFATTDGTTFDSVEFNSVIPIGFVRARMDLPFSGWYFEADSQLISYSGNSFTDSSAKIGWQVESILDLGVNAGYRSMRLNIEDIDDAVADIDISGPFASLTFHF